VSAEAAPGLLGGVFAPNAPNMIDPKVLGLGGQVTVDRLRGLGVEERVRPDVIVVVSPHWVSAGPFLVDPNPRPRFIEDFSGFPRALYGHTYRPPGDPALARRIVEEATRRGLAAETSDRWGLDHGAWTALAALAPSARIPVVPVSISRASPAEHVEFGRAVSTAVASAGKRGYLVGTGLILHNFSRLSMEAGAPPWTEGIAIEREILDHIERGDVDGVAEFDRRKWREVEPEGDLAPYFVVAGGLGERFRARVVGIERSFGSAGLAVIEFRPR
jgi:4,5-DOPA dioxygenase extradiol